MKKKNVMVCLTERTIELGKKLAEEEGRSFSGLIESLIRGNTDVKNGMITLDNFAPNTLIEHTMDIGPGWTEANGLWEISGKKFPAQIRRINHILGFESDEECVKKVQEFINEKMKDRNRNIDYKLILFGDKGGHKKVDGIDFYLSAKKRIKNK